MGLLVDHWLSLWGTASLRGGFDYHFSFLVFTKVVGEGLASLEFFVYGPKSGAFWFQIIGKLRLESLISLFTVFKDDHDWLPVTETMESWIGHHHETSHSVQLIKKSLLVHQSLLFY